MKQPLKWGEPDGIIFELYWARVRKELNMGKDLKNREIGKGLSQRKDGRYSARFVTCAGHREQKYFDTIVQARNWLQDARYRDRHDTVIAPFDLAADSILNDDADVPVLSDMTVDAWFDFWTKNIIPDLRSNTLRNYRDRYRFNSKSQSSLEASRTRFAACDHGYLCTCVG